MKGYEVRLKNRRVFGAATKEKDVTRFKFTILKDGKPFVTEIKLSDEALAAMVDIWEAIANEK